MPGEPSLGISPEGEVGSPPNLRGGPRAGLSRILVGFRPHFYPGTPGTWPWVHPGRLPRPPTFKPRAVERVLGMGGRGARGEFLLRAPPEMPIQQAIIGTRLPHKRDTIGTPSAHRRDTVGTSSGQRILFSLAAGRLESLGRSYASGARLRSPVHHSLGPRCPLVLLSRRLWRRCPTTSTGWRPRSAASTGTWRSCRGPEC